MGKSGSGHETTVEADVINTIKITVPFDSFFQFDAPRDEEPIRINRMSLHDRVLAGLGIKTYGEFSDAYLTQQKTTPTSAETRKHLAREIALEMMNKDGGIFNYDDKTYAQLGYFLSIDNWSDIPEGVEGVREFNVVYCVEDDKWHGLAVRTDYNGSLFMEPSNNMDRSAMEAYMKQLTPFNDDKDSTADQKLVNFLIDNYNIFREKSIGRVATSQ